jgi:hypothetical protein
LKPDADSILVADVEQSARDLLAHVPRDAVRRITAAQRSLVD